jgi:hypothetical protein
MKFSFPPMSNHEINMRAEALAREYQPDVIEGKCCFDIQRFMEIHLKDLTGMDLDYEQLACGIHAETSVSENKVKISADHISELKMESLYMLKKCSPCGLKFN